MILILTHNFSKGLKPPTRKDPALFCDYDGRIQVVGSNSKLMILGFESPTMRVTYGGESKGNKT